MFATAVGAGCAGSTDDATAPAEDVALGRTEQAEQLVQTCVDLPARADSTLSSLQRHTNFGDQPTVRTSRYLEGLLRFDLGALPSGATIHSATMRLHLSTSGGVNTVYVYRAADWWRESEVTYANFEQDVDWTVLGTLLANGADVSRSVDLTNLTRAWANGSKPNHGVLLWSNSETESVFVSREGGAPGQQPHLRACYTTSAAPCEAAPCQHGGTCSNVPGGYECACAPGYEGPNCELDIDECAAAPCLNGGVCTDGVNGYTCACAPGYEGPSCELDINDCDPDPCQHGGTCVDGVASYTCSCPIGYTGPHCEIDVDDCSDAPCQHGGTCQDGVNSYTCACPAGYGGTHCEVDLDDCAPNPCQHGGTCTDGVASYTCACPPGYLGDDCEIDVDDCAGSPCLNGGTCLDGANSYTCACTIDWVGETCEVNACEDDNPCTSDHNTLAGCVHAPSPSDPACRRATGSIEAGAFHTCAIRAGGEVYCWGMRDAGRLGNGSTTPGYALVPVQVSNLTDAVALGLGYDHSCAVRANGTVACWGANGSGQLGTGNTAASSVPAQVTGITDAVSVTAGRGHTCVLRATGQLACFGLGNVGQLGRGTTQSSSVPVPVIDDVDLVGPLGTPLPHEPLPWIAVTTSELFTCGLRASGQVLCWGSNDNGQLGFGAIGNRSQPSLVLNLPDAIAVTAGRFHACALKADTTVACWGASAGLGRTGPDLHVLDLIGDPANPFSGSVTIAASGYHTCATSSLGRTWCWGQSQQGQVGAQVANAPIPRAVAGPLLDTSSVATASGNCHACALLEDDTVRCWGSTPAVASCQSQLGWGVAQGSVAPVTPLLPAP